MKFIDANIFIRFITQDDPVKGAACYDLFRRVRVGEEDITTCETTITEVVNVLTSRSLYGISPENVRSSLSPVLRLRRLRLVGKDAVLRALDILIAYPALGFADALIAAHMHETDLTELVSYDRDFDRLPGIRREEPLPRTDEDNADPPIGPD